MPYILVVEGDPSVRELLVEFLTEAGHDVVALATAQAARASLKQAPVELAIVECVLAGEPGEAFAQHIASLGTPAIVISGDVARLEWARATGLPALAKPFRLTQLTELVAGALGRDRRNAP